MVDFLMKALLSRNHPDQPHIHSPFPAYSPEYRLNWFRRIAFGLRVVRNKHRVQTGTTYKAAW